MSNSLKITISKNNIVNLLKHVINIDKLTVRNFLVQYLRESGNNRIKWTFFTKLIAILENVKYKVTKSDNKKIIVVESNNININKLINNNSSELVEIKSSDYNEINFPYKRSST